MKDARERYDGVCCKEYMPSPLATLKRQGCQQAQRKVWCRLLDSSLCIESRMQRGMSQGGRMRLCSSGRDSTWTFLFFGLAQRTPTPLPRCRRSLPTRRAIDKRQRIEIPCVDTVVPESPPHCEAVQIPIL